MFRRPKKPIRPRVIMINNGDEEDDGDMDYEENNIESKPVVPAVPVPVKEELKVPKKSTLLSFDEENDEEEEEVFKVKKSSVSRRLMKERKKKETKAKKSDSKFQPSSTTTTGNSTENQEEADSILKVTNFVRILSGREAEAVDMESSDEEDNDTQVKFKRRNPADAVSEVLRRTLEKEQIPDANLIHEIRKKRQMARDTGGSGAAPFIPVDDSITYKPTKSRLIREDDNDQSEDDDEKRIDFSFDSTNADKERRREAFDAAQDQDRDHQSESDSDHELEEWERQQIRKGVSQAQLQLATQQQDLSMDTTGNGEFLNLNDPTPKISASRSEASRIEDVMGGKTLRSVDSIFKQLSDRLEGLHVTKENHEGELSRLRVEGDLLETEIDECTLTKQSLSSRLRLYQGIHCYVHDLIDCLRCKVPEIQDLENRTLGLFQAHAEFLMKRRRQDRDDQYEECCSTLRPTPTIKPDREVEEREKRGAERKGRRTRRRKEREDSNIRNHNEGMSTDDEELEFDSQRFKNMRESILEAASQVFADVNEDYYEIYRILGKFLEWRTEDGGAYRDSYVPLCVPKVLSPVIRIELLHFDPLHDEFDIFQSTWMKSLISFGFSPGETREMLASDPDVKLVPGVCEKVVIPWIERVVTAEYDPVSTTQTKRLIYLVRKLLSDYTININSKQIHNLLKSILTKIEEATDKDVFIPMFDTSALTRSSEVSVFASRQFYSSVKLLDNICAWSGILSEKQLQTLALDKLMARYIVSSVRLSVDLQEAVKRAQAVVNVLPRVWLNDSETPHGIRHLIRALLVLVQERTDFSLPMNKSQVEPMAGVLRALGATKEADVVSLKYA